MIGDSSVVPRYRRCRPSSVVRVGHPVFASFTISYYAPVRGVAWVGWV